eukprot:CAMPEP_0206138438 /NCGR_PEP_ID=MMETSP1473-20131121/3326_1 /ASSEMBLY_ACC=CAM_ASM_001109 /TAXON_ID=1461547 /ORGANISM="Stichococcus sp, Strain RCC1054" /LENGTH=286 /DNA_ID=CAMNT_0053531879 /DNA_START=288 /DNA_END=1148 /DNA_ORIENTATION=+
MLSPGASGAGGLSQAFAAADGSKKRGLSSLTVSPMASAPASFTSPSQPQFGSVLRQQDQQLRGNVQPNALLQQRLQGSGGSGSSFHAPLSPSSTATPHSTTPLSDTLGASASAPLSKVPRRRPAGPFGNRARGEDSDDSDDDGYDVGMEFDSEPVGSLPRHMQGSYVPQQQTRGHRTSMDIPNRPTWSLGGGNGVPPHLMAGSGTGAVSMPQHNRSMGGFHRQDSPHNAFRPGSVMEGAGRKLSGTDAMRMRNQVLRQTGFLEPQTNHTQMFADHEGLSSIAASPV